MAKALVGHLGAPDPRLAREALLLRRRVADLEAEVIRLKHQNDSLNLALSGHPVTERGPDRRLEPALR